MLSGRASELLMKVEALLLSMPQREARKDVSFEASEHSVLNIPPKADGPAYEVVAILDPTTRAAQKYTPFIMVCGCCACSSCFLFLLFYTVHGMYVVIVVVELLVFLFVSCFSSNCFCFVGVLFLLLLLLLFLSLFYLLLFLSLDYFFDILVIVFFSRLLRFLNNDN